MATDILFRSGKIYAKTVGHDIETELRDLDERTRIIWSRALAVEMVNALKGELGSRPGCVVDLSVATYHVVVMPYVSAGGTSGRFKVHYCQQGDGVEILKVECIEFNGEPVCYERDARQPPQSIAGYLRRRLDVLDVEWFAFEKLIQEVCVI